MKNSTKQPTPQLPSIVKFVCKAFKSIFESNSKSDFARLKNFIGS